MANIKDISRLSGCSKSTVSRYLNNGSVSKHTAEKIKKVIDEIGYTPNAFAQSLKANTTNTIGAIIPNFVGMTKNLTLNSIDDYLKKRSYKMYISNSNNNMSDEVKIMHSMAAQKLDGIILFASRITEGHRKAFRNIGIPVVVIGQEVEEVYCVLHDEYKAGKLVGDYIKATGYKKVSYLGVGTEDKSISKRFEAITDVLKDEDIEVVEHCVGFDAESSYAKTMEIYDDEKAELYIGATDNIAFGIMRALHEKGVSIPEESSVIGFGDYGMDIFLTPQLSTVQINHKMAAQKAAEILLDLINGEDIQESIVLDCSLKLRESTK